MKKSLLLGLLLLPVVCHADTALTLYDSTTHYVQLRPTAVMGKTFYMVLPSTPGTVGQVLGITSISGSSVTMKYINQTSGGGGGGGGVWGAITGTLSDQTDLQSILNSIGVATGTLKVSITSLGASTGTLNASIVALGVSTGTLLSSINALGLSTGTLSVSTTSLQTQINAVGVSTGTLLTLINSVSVATGTLASNIQAALNAIAVSTAAIGQSTSTLQSNINAVGLATGTIVPNLLKSTNTWTGNEIYTSSGGLNITYGVVAGSVAVSSITASGAMTAGSLLLNTPLPVASGGTGTASPTISPGTNITSVTGTWPNVTINAATQAGGAGSSPVAVSSGGPTFTTLISSPTRVILFDSNTVIVSLLNGNTAYIQPNPSSVTLQGNFYSIANIATDTGTFRTILNAVAVSTSAIGVSTGSLQTQITATALSTQTLANALGVSTGSLQTQITATALSTQTLATAVGLATSTLQTQVNTKVNYSSFTATQPIVYNNTTGALSATLISATTGFMGTLQPAQYPTAFPSSVLPSTIAYTVSTNTWTAYQNFTSSITHSGAIYVSSSILLSGSPGANGNVLTSGGNGAVPTWQANSASVAWGAITGTLSAQTDLQTALFAVGSATQTLAVSTGSLQTQETATAVATGTLRTDLTATAVATGTLRTDLNAVSVATGVIVSNLLKSTNTWTAVQNFVSSETHAGGVYISSTILLSGAPGTNGQSLLSGGNGAVPTWGNPSASVAWGNITGTLSAQTDLQTAIFAVGTSTTALSASTVTLQTQANAIAIATGTLRTDLNAVSVATGVIVSNLLKSTNTWTGYQNYVSSVTNAGAVYISSTVELNGSPGTNGQVLTTGGNGAVPSWQTPAVGDITSVVAGFGLTGGGVNGDVVLTVVSSAAFTVSTQTWTAYQNFTSSITEAGGVYVSSTVLLSGSPGSNGQVLTSGGNGAVPSWQNSSGGASVTSTNTWTAVQNFTSSVTNSGGIYISSTVLLSGSPGSNGQFLTTGGNGTIPTWTSITAAGLASTQTWTAQQTFQNPIIVGPSSATFQGGVVISSGILISTPTFIINSTTTITSTMSVVFASCTVTSAVVPKFMTLTLPSAQTNSGESHMIYKVDSSTCEIRIQTSAVGQVIQGTRTITLDAQTQHASIYSLGNGIWGEGIGGIQTTPWSIVSVPMDNAAYITTTSSIVVQCPIYVPVPINIIGFRADKAAGAGLVSFGIFDQNGIYVVGVTSATAVSSANNYMMTPNYNLAPGWYKITTALSSSAINLSGANSLNDVTTWCSQGATPTHINLSQVTLTTGGNRNISAFHVGVLINGGQLAN